MLYIGSIRWGHALWWEIIGRRIAKRHSFARIHTFSEYVNCRGILVVMHRLIGRCREIFFCQAYKLRVTFAYVVHQTDGGQEKLVVVALHPFSLFPAM